MKAVRNTLGAPGCKRRGDNGARRDGDRPVLHPHPRVVLHYAGGAESGLPDHQGPLSIDEIKILLGWETEHDFQVRIGEGLTEGQRVRLWSTKKGQYGDDYLLVDDDGNKVRCLNNDRNRPFNVVHARRLALACLNGRWKYNGEACIVGRTGRILSAQHRLVGAVLAEQMRTGARAGHWAAIHPGPVELETNIAYGISEDSDTVRTLDNVRPRTLSDVLFSDPDLFRRATGKDRAALTKMAANAVALLWMRTGAKADVTTYLSHPEAEDFLARHPTVLKCVETVWVLDNGAGTAGGGDGAGGDNGARYRVQYYMPAGYAAAMLYLMGTCTSDGARYRSGPATTWCEKNLSKGAMATAVAFWELLAAQAPEVQWVTRARRTPEGDNGAPGPAVYGAGAGGGSLRERWGTIIKAWHLYRTGKTITASGLYLEYRTGRDGDRVLVDGPVCGGADVQGGRAPDEADGTVHQSHLPEYVPDAAAIEDGKDTERSRREADDHDKEGQRRLDAQRRRDAKDRDTAPAPLSDDPDVAAAIAARRDLAARVNATLAARLAKDGAG